MGPIPSYRQSFPYIAEKEFGQVDNLRALIPRIIHSYLWISRLGPKTAHAVDVVGAREYASFSCKFVILADGEVEAQYYR